MSGIAKYGCECQFTVDVQTVFSPMLLLDVAAW